MSEMRFSAPQPEQNQERKRTKRELPDLPMEGDIEFDVEFHPDQRLRQIARAIKDFVNNPDNYLDHGGAAIVYELGGDADVCVKLVKNRHKQEGTSYDLGNDIREETKILKKLSNFSVDGVRSPEFISVLTGNKYGALVMERLDAVNLQHVLNGEEKMPEAFNQDTFFDELDAYITRLHDEQKICHMDLEPRNIMVDRKTGKPLVIDFGRSISIEKMSPQKARQKEEDDLRKLEVGEIAVKRLFTSIDKKD